MSVNLATAVEFHQEIARLQAEIERLREAIRRLAEQDATLSVVGGNVTATMDATLTDAERFVLCEVRDYLADRDDVAANEQAAVIDGLLERTKPDRPEPIAAVPPEWLQRPYWVDPPSGWQYGFPRLYDPATDGDMTEWMIQHGYPEHLARQGLPCTFTAYTEDGGK